MGNIADKYERLHGDVEGESDDVNEIPDRIKNLAAVLKTGPFDIIALQEVYAGERGEWALSDLSAALSDATGISYAYFISDYIGDGLIPEAIGFIYDPEAATPLRIPGTDNFTENIEIPGRDLVRTEWKAGEFDFTLISAHLAWGNETDRDAGYNKVEEILATPVPSSYSSDPDIVVLGDFNRFGANYDSVLELDWDSGKILAPNITFFDPAFNTVKGVKKSNVAGKGVRDDNPQFLSTTVAQNTYAYDIVFMTSDADEEFSGNAASSVYGVDFGIVHYDEKDGFGYQKSGLGYSGRIDRLSHDELKKAYSDHRPLWVRFDISTGTSDGADEAAVSYVVTKYGKKFHHLDCPTIRGREFLNSWKLREEVENSYDPCGICKP
jgi:hypothetical protein